MNELKRVFNRFFQTPTNKAYYLVICCIIKDENEYLEEWIKYHLKVGVEHFYIYDNDSKIPVSETLKKLGVLNRSTVKVISGKAKQVKAYQDYLNRYKNQSRWAAFIDIDEFIVCTATEGKIAEFLKEYEPYGGLGINWLLFGSSGLKTRKEGSQLENFTLRSEKNFKVNEHIKCIVQNKFVKSVKNSHSFNYIDGKFCVNENFQIIDGVYSEISAEKIRINHYYCRSFEEYQEKIKRGLGDTRRKRLLEEFYHHDAESNKVVDTNILEIINKLGK